MRQKLPVKFPDTSHLFEDFPSFTQYRLVFMRYQYRQLALIFWLLSHTVMSQAVQLGSARGTVVFGQTLDLTVPVRLDAQNDDAATCFTADIYQADTRFDAGRVRLEVSPIGKNLDANVRIRSITKINEPWAKLVLSSNCGTRISKSYEFLTEFSSELPASEATQAINKSIAPPVTAVPATLALISPSNKPVLPAVIKKAIANR